MVRPIEINWVANGWTVKVGCQQFVYISSASLAADLKVYLDNPEHTEKLFLEKSLNIRYTNDELRTARALMSTGAGCAMGAEVDRRAVEHCLTAAGITPYTGPSVNQCVSNEDVPTYHSRAVLHDR